jgi:superfamily II helicase
MQICEHCFDSNSISNFIVNNGIKSTSPTICSLCDGINYLLFNDNYEYLDYEIRNLNIA